MCSITFRFEPEVAVSYLGNSNIPSNDPLHNPAALSLSGIGIQQDISVSPVNVIFEEVVVGDFAIEKIKVKNDGTAPLTLWTIGAPSPPFSRVGGDCANGQILVPNDTCWIIVEFAPETRGPFVSGFSITSDDPDENPVEVSLTGTGLSAIISLTTDSVDFGKVVVGTTAEGAIEVRNDGDADLVIGRVSDPVSPFAKVLDTCSTQSLGPGEACQIGLEFIPTKREMATSSISIPSNDPFDSLATVNLAGNGVYFTITPEDGTLGTEITLKGDFGTKKGKVTIGQAALKVIDWKTDTIHASLGKVMSPEIAYDVVVTPKEPKAVKPITEPKAFTMKGPEITSVEPGSGTSGSPSPIIIKGRFFGNKKGKVTLERAGVVKPCKVLTWTMDPTGIEDQIQFTVPKGLAATEGYVLRVTNKVGWDTKAFIVNP